MGVYNLNSVPRILSMRGNIVLNDGQIKFFSCQTLIFKHIECKNSKEIKIGVKKNSHACVPLSYQLRAIRDTDFALCV